MQTVITLINGKEIKGKLIHYHHKHPKDADDYPERKNWHYYVDEDTGDIHHLRKEHIVSVTELAEHKNK